MIRIILIAILGLVPALACAETSSSMIPETPAGELLGLWLDAFNSGDRGRIESFIQAHVPEIDLNAALRLRAQTGGYQLLRIEKSEPTKIIFRLLANAAPIEQIGRLKTKPGDASAIAELRVFRIPAGAKFEDIELDTAARARVIDGAARMLEESYVFADIGKSMATSLRTREKRGQYNDFTDGEAFAVRLTGDLRAISHDQHVEVRFSLVVQPPSAPMQPPGAAELEAINCGFEKAEHMPPNIGYLKFNVFADPQICGRTASAAMNFLADSDALVIDLRDNNGGISGMVTLMASYLFAEPTHLNDSYARKGNSIIQFWTSPYVPGKRFIGKPVFLLTSRATFSAAEDFSYALKNLKRASLIGETTGGGAHPIEVDRIDDHFSIVVPFARSISPVTKSDWEGTGVEPDIKVSAADALEEALKRARSASQNTRPADSL